VTPGGSGVACIDRLLRMETTIGGISHRRLNPKAGT